MMSSPFDDNVSRKRQKVSSDDDEAPAVVIGAPNVLEFKLPPPETYRQPSKSEGYNPPFFDKNVLFEYVNHPANYNPVVFCETAKFVVIYDIFPKAKVHLLILTKPLFLSNLVKRVSDLDSSHLDLILEMGELSKYLSSHPVILKQMARSIVNNNTGETIDAPRCSRRVDILTGFHIIPSLQPLHLHMISNDFQSDLFKTRAHYLSFSTDFLVPLALVIRSIKMNPNIVGNLYSKYKSGHGKADDLKCFLCGHTFKTIPSLKCHLGGCSKGYDTD